MVEVGYSVFYDLSARSAKRLLLACHTVLGTSRGSINSLRDYVYADYTLWIQYDFSWFEATLECGRVPVPESCGLLMIDKNYEKALISLLETLKEATGSQ